MKPATRKNILALLERYRRTIEHLERTNRDLDRANVRLCQESGQQNLRIDELTRKLNRLMTTRVDYDACQDHYTLAYRINGLVLKTARDPQAIWDMALAELRKGILTKTPRWS